MRCVRSFQNQFDASFYRKQLFEIATFSFEFVAIVLVCSNYFKVYLLYIVLFVLTPPGLGVVRAGLGRPGWKGNGSAKFVTITMAARQLNVLDGIERQMTRGRPKKGEGKKSRSDNKLSSDANRGDINVETGSANEIAAQALPCQSAASDVTVVPPTEVASVPAMAATQADFQQLQTTVSALALQMSWFVDRLKEDDDGELIPDADIVETTASTSSAVPAPDESNRNEVNVLTGLQQFYGASENVAAAIDDQLASIVGGLSANKLAEDKLRDKLEAYPRAENCPGLVVAKVNQEVWDKLSPGTRSADIKLRHSYLGKSSTQAQRGQHKSARAGYNKRKDM